MTQLLSIIVGPVLEDFETLQHWRVQINTVLNVHTLGTKNYFAVGSDTPSRFLSKDHS